MRIVRPGKAIFCNSPEHLRAFTNRLFMEKLLTLKYWQLLLLVVIVPVSILLIFLIGMSASSENAAVLSYLFTFLPMVIGVILCAPFIWIRTIIMSFKTQTEEYYRIAQVWLKVFLVALFSVFPLFTFTCFLCIDMLSRFFGLFMASKRPANLGSELIGMMDSYFTIIISGFILISLMLFAVVGYFFVIHAAAKIYKTMESSEMPSQ